MKALALGIIVLGLVTAWVALGAPPEGADLNSPLAQWYRSLQTPQGMSCCDMADCRPVRARQVADDAGGHWEIFVGEEGQPKIWEAVPPDRVLRHNNEDGRPIACRFGGRILCFVPPSMT